MSRVTLGEKLLNIYDRMLNRYGPQHWWPGDTRFEIMVGAVLTQAAAWANVEKAISNLAAASALVAARRCAAWAKRSWLSSSTPAGTTTQRRGS